MQISNGVYSGAWDGVKNIAPSMDAVSDRFEGITTAAGFPVFGTYQPVGSHNTNAGNLTLSVAQYVKVNDVVIVFGTFTTRITATGQQTSFCVSLPFASNFSANNQAGGAGPFASRGNAFTIYSDTTDKLVRFSTFLSSLTASDLQCSYMYGYRIIP